MEMGLRKGVRILFFGNLKLVDCVMEIDNLLDHFQIYRLLIIGIPCGTAG